MKPNLLRRLESLESIVEQTARPPFRLVDVLTLEAAEREEYWSGPEGEIAVLTRIGVPVQGESTGSIHTVVIDLHSSSREKWEATAGMDDDALEQVAILEDQLREREERRREGAERERWQREALQATLEQVPPAPANAYSPKYDRG